MFVEVTGPGSQPKNTAVAKASTPAINQER